jgi:hypothetical protein
VLTRGLEWQVNFILQVHFWCDTWQVVHYYLTSEDYICHTLSATIITYRFCLLARIKSKKMKWKLSLKLIFLFLYICFLWHIHRDGYIVCCSVTRVPRASYCIIIITPWPESANELDRPNDRRLSSKVVPTFAEKRCHVVSATDFHDRILGFLDRSTSAGTPRY